MLHNNVLFVILFLMIFKFDYFKKKLRSQGCDSRVCGEENAADYIRI